MFFEQVKCGNTSLDIYAIATVEDPNTGISRTVCSAFFVYVTCRDASGVRPKVPKLERCLSDENGKTPTFSEKSVQGTDDWLTFVAGERRKILPTMQSALQRKISVVESEDSGSLDDLDSLVSASDTLIDVLELCLPTNLNHMAHTFGGVVFARV